MISVVVPIFNAEAYLRRALDSILSQTCKDWEAILVDDGSTDSSGHIAQEYAQRDTRFKVIHKQNSGQSDARNLGMQHIAGEFLLFLDADDFLHPQLITLCMEAMQRDGSDMVCFTYDRSYRTMALVKQFLHLDAPKPHYKFYKEPPYITTDDIFLYATEHSHPKGIKERWAVKHCQAWRCMYKTYAVRDIKFIPGIIYEDFPWWSEVLLRVGRCTILNLPLYFYSPNPSSDILSTSQEHKIESLRKAIEAAKSVYADAPAQKRKTWERHFLAPFEQKLRKKEARL
ncbi:MAG: glycosyltransferase [Bacteroidaceae bacterium]|nr:glycosyltransferase [Bacteroidaceae bacterium]